MEINRLKEVLKEKKKTSKWLAEEMGVSYVTVSRWCNNVFQPKMESFVRIAELLEVDVRELIVPTKKED